MVLSPSLYANQPTPFQSIDGCILSRQELPRVILNKNAMIGIVVGPFFESSKTLLQAMEHI